MIHWAKSRLIFLALLVVAITYIALCLYYADANSVNYIVYSRGLLAFLVLAILFVLPEIKLSQPNTKPWSTLSNVLELGLVLLFLSLLTEGLMQQLNFAKSWQYFLVVLGQTVAFAIIAIMVCLWVICNGKRIDKLALLVDKDSLTQLDNRRAFLVKANIEMDKATRYQYPVALLFIDIDDFKMINDKYGHGAGDEVLASLAKKIKGNIRRSDLIVRWGGDEFIILLPFASFTVAVQVADKLRQLFLPLPIFNQEKQISIKLSIGIACQQDDDNIDELIQRADKSMYIEKKCAQNQT